MLMRNIVKIDEEKCNGCGQCVNACAEGAIKLINSKAKLVSEIYCDGLGACIGHCPQDAITIEKREAEEFDEQATQKHLSEQKKMEEQLSFVCPGMMSKQLREKKDELVKNAQNSIPSELSHWPVQLKLVPPNAPYFANAELLLVADCVPFAMGNFHDKFLKDHSIAIGCPKLDDKEFYIDKLATIIKVNNLKSLKVIHMEVPCCSGLTEIARQAISKNKIAMKFEDVTIDLQGNICRSEVINV
jgi:ferredoxin